MLLQSQLPRRGLVADLLPGAGCSPVQHCNPIALKTAKTLLSFGRSECNRVKQSFGHSECNRVKWRFGCFECNRLKFVDAGCFAE